MYDENMVFDKDENVTGPCEFLVMYDLYHLLSSTIKVTGPCEFLVMYDLDLFFIFI